MCLNVNNTVHLLRVFFAAAVSQATVATSSLAVPRPSVISRYLVRIARSVTEQLLLERIHCNMHMHTFVAVTAQNAISLSGCNSAYFSVHEYSMA